MQSWAAVDTIENPVAGTWVVKTTPADSEAPWSIFVHTNKLGPISFVPVRQFKQLGVFEFIGELRGPAQPLIVVEVNPFAPGVLTFTLPLDHAEMAAALRAFSSSAHRG